MILEKISKVVDIIDRRSLLLKTERGVAVKEIYSLIKNCRNDSLEGATIEILYIFAKDKSFSNKCYNKIASKLRSLKHKRL